MFRFSIGIFVFELCSQVGSCATLLLFQIVEIEQTLSVKQILRQKLKKDNSNFKKS